MNLIGTVFIIVILAVSISVVVPHCIEVNSRQEFKQIKKYAAALSQASMKNYFLRKSDASKGVPVMNCDQVTNTFNEKIPENYQIVSAIMDTDKMAFCTLHGPTSTTAIFSVRAIN